MHKSNKFNFDEKTVDLVESSKRTQQNLLPINSIGSIGTKKVKVESRVDLDCDAYFTLPKKPYYIEYRERIEVLKDEDYRKLPENVRMRDIVTIRLTGRSGGRANQIIMVRYNNDEFLTVRSLRDIRSTSYRNIRKKKFEN